MTRSETPQTSAISQTAPASGTSARSETATILVSRGLRKRYSGVQALRGVDFDVHEGEVHALVGENGAGKSTLIKIVSGAEAADAGTVDVGGRRLAPGDTNAALAAGIATVYQEPQLFGELTVAENIFLGRELRRGGRLIDWGAQRSRVGGLLERLGLDPVLADVRAADLPVAEQQLVSIAKAFAHDVRVLILDEPSAILTDQEVQTLFRVIDSVKAEGVGVIYISHRLDELVVVADRVTVLRDGEVVATRPARELTVRQTAELMTGHALEERQVSREAPASDPVLEARGLGAAGSFHDVDLVLNRGEVVGLYGLVGSGVNEVARALYGIDPADTGTVTVGGRVRRLRGTRDAVRAGVAMLPANRKVQGVFASKSIGFNISIGHLRLLSRFGVAMDRRRERAVAADFLRRIAIKAPGVHSLVGTLSGGNQQKVVLARSLVERPDVLVLEEPTQGVDVGAKDEIHDIVLSLADQGSAVLVVSSDLAELQRLADRVLVMREGRPAGEFARGASQADLLSAAAGGDEQEAPTSLDEARAAITEEVNQP
jgi:rhamnose transport system ATP-binding protein